MRIEGDRRFYEVSPSTLHIHLVCLSCGSVQEPEGRFWESMKGKVFRETGFKPEIVRLEMGGRCADCRTGKQGGTKIKRN
jgi:Fe2+ or Zn2+ uptake regulation protein